MELFPLIILSVIFREKFFWKNQLFVHSLVETHINFLIPARNNSCVVSWLGDWYWRPVSLILFGLSCQFEDPYFLRGDMRRGWSLITYPRAGIFPTVCRFDLGGANELILPTLLKSSTKNFVLGRGKQKSCGHFPKRARIERYYWMKQWQ